VFQVTGELAAAALEYARLELPLQRPGGAPFAEDFRRHALPDLALRVAVFEQQVVGVRVHVDEAGADDETLRVDRALRLSFRHAADRDDLVAGDRDGAMEPRVAGAVHDAPVRDEEVVFGLCGGRGQCEEARDERARCEQREEEFHECLAVGEEEG
jgi:hypothetical protein